jgi:hypothetical protein
MKIFGKGWSILQRRRSSMVLWQPAGQQVRVGMEASGHARQFERLLVGLRCELWIEDAAEMQSKRGRKQKTQRATDDATISEAKAA